MEGVPSFHSLGRGRSLIVVSFLAHKKIFFSPLVLDSGHNGCQHVRVGRCPGAEINSGLLDTGGIQGTDQCIGTKGDQAVPGSLDGTSLGAPSAYPIRQCHSSGLCQTLEVSGILRWAESHIPALCAMYIPGVDNWQMDYLSRQVLNQGEWSLHSDGFHLLCRWWGTPDVDLLVSQLNRKVPRFVARSRDPLADATDALVAPLRHYRLVYAFPPLKILPWLLHRTEAEGLLVALDWSHQSWYSDLAGLVVDVPWRLPRREDLLSQGPVFHPALQSLGLTAWLLRARC